MRKGNFVLNWTNQEDWDHICTVSSNLPIVGITATLLLYARRVILTVKSIMTWVRLHTNAGCWHLLLCNPFIFMAELVSRIMRRLLRYLLTDRTQNSLWINADLPGPTFSACRLHCCLQPAKALARLHRCAVGSEPLLVAFALSTVCLVAADIMSDIDLHTIITLHLNIPWLH